MSASNGAAAPSGSVYGGLGPTLIGVCWSLCIIATILVALRTYARLTVVKSGGGWSLIWAYVAWALGVPSVVLYTIAAVYGLGNHIQYVAAAPHLADALLYEWIAAVTISFSVGFGKASALAFILDVQGHTHGWARYALFFFLGINFMAYIVTVPMIFTQCSPASKLWNQMLPGNCDGVNRAYYWAVFTGAWGAATDLLLALYPSFLVYNLQIKLRLKLVLSLLMGLGVLTAICSIVKTVQFNRLRATKDATYQIAPLMIWGQSEMWVVLIASSVAPLWPLLRRSAGRVTQSSSRKTYGNDYSGSLFSRRKETSRSTGDRDVSSKSNQSSFNKLGSHPGSQVAIVDDNGIEMTKDITVQHQTLSQARESADDLDLGRTYGRAQTTADDRV